MSLHVSEIWKSADGALGRNSFQEFKLQVWGDPVADDAENPATFVPAALSRLGAITVFGQTFSGVAWEWISPGRHLVTATYRAPEIKNTADASFSFQTSGGRKHVDFAIATISTSVPSGKTAANYGGAIGVSGKAGVDYHVAGVDVQVPNFAFKTTFYVAPSNMTTDYVEALHTNTGSVNSDVVHISVDGIDLTCQPGELLMIGADGQKRIGIGDWELALSWAKQANLTSIPIGGTAGSPVIIVPAKRGFHYLWVHYGNPQLVSGNLVQMPDQANVEQIYPEAPLSGILPVAEFGIGTALPWTSPTIFVGAGFA